SYQQLLRGLGQKQNYERIRRVSSVTMTSDSRIPNRFIATSVNPRKMLLIDNKSIMTMKEPLGKSVDSPHQYRLSTSAQQINQRNKTAQSITLVKTLRTSSAKIPSTLQDFPNLSIVPPSTSTRPTTNHVKVTKVPLRSKSSMETSSVTEQSREYQPIN